jgi:hypothetical protein
MSEGGSAALASRMEGTGWMTRTPESQRGKQKQALTLFREGLLPELLYLLPFWLTEPRPFTSWLTLGRP